VVGIGSPHGDDRVGWRIVELLQGRELRNTDVVAVQGGVPLVECLRDCQTAILVDACRSGAAAGTISRLEWPDPRIALQHHRSTHGFDVASALDLAQRLDRLPPRVVVYGVEMQRCEPGAELSPEVDAVLANLVSRILSELGRNGGTE